LPAEEQGAKAGCLVEHRHEARLELVLDEVLGGANIELRTRVAVEAPTHDIEDAVCLGHLSPGDQGTGLVAIVREEALEGDDVRRQVGIARTGASGAER
jgi:hypothetical protein